MRPVTGKERSLGFPSKSDECGYSLLDKENSRGLDWNSKLNSAPSAFWDKCSSNSDAKGQLPQYLVDFLEMVPSPIAESPPEKFTFVIPSESVKELVAATLKASP